MKAVNMANAYMTTTGHDAEHIMEEQGFTLGDLLDDHDDVG